MLRVSIERDLDDMTALYADGDVARFITLDGKAQSREYAWRMMATFRGHWALRGYGMWALEEKGTGRCVGWCGPWFPEGWPAPEVGWSLARPWWGKGLATEAARRALAHARNHLKWPRAIHVINPLNLRSIAAAERLGSRCESTWNRDGKELLIYGQSF